MTKGKLYARLALSGELIYVIGTLRVGPGESRPLRRCTHDLSWA